MGAPWWASPSFVRINVKLTIPIIGSRKQSSNSTLPLRPHRFGRKLLRKRTIANGGSRVSPEIASKAREIPAGRRRSRDLRLPPTSRDRTGDPGAAPALGWRCDFPRRLACERRRSCWPNTCRRSDKVELEHVANTHDDHRRDRRNRRDSFAQRSHRVLRSTSCVILKVTLRASRSACYAVNWEPCPS